MRIPYGFGMVAGSENWFRFEKPAKSKKTRKFRFTYFGRGAPLLQEAQQSGNPKTAAIRFFHFWFRVPKIIIKPNVFMAFGKKAVNAMALVKSAKVTVPGWTCVARHSKSWEHRARYGSRPTNHMVSRGYTAISPWFVTFGDGKWASERTSHQ